MKKKLLPLLLCSWFIISCASTPTLRQSAPETSVWRVSKNGETLYLAGTIHMLPSHVEIPRAFGQCFQEADTTVFEADALSLQSDLLKQAELRHWVMLQEGKTLKTVLSPQSYEKLSMLCKQMGVDINTCEGVKPSVVLNMLELLQAQEYGFTSPGADMIFLKQARRAQKEVLFLESIDFQLELLLSVFDDDMDEYIDYCAREMRKTREEQQQEWDALLDDWLNGRDSAMAPILREVQDYPGVYERLYKKRNDAWVPIIEGYFHRPGIELVMVGLGHLHGGDGLLARLMEGGYTVEAYYKE